MQTHLRRVLVGAGLAAALIGGGSIAFADTQQAPPQNGVQTFLDDVASHLGVTPAALQSAIQAAETDRLNQAVASGKISQAQAAKIQQAIQSGKIGVFGFGGFRGFRGPKGGGPFADLSAAASFLGLTPQQLLTQLQGGQTLARIASEQGKTVQDLENALLAQAKQKLDQAVSSGRMTAAQEQTALSQMQQRIDQMVTQVWKPHGAGQWRGQGAKTQPAATN